jgi:hypothetical protein
MPNALYPKWKEAISQNTANSSLTGTVKVALVDTGTYTYSAAHEFYSSVSGVVGTPQTIGSKTYTNGVFDGSDVTFTAVSGASAEALVLYIDTGTAGTSRLVAFIDTSVTGLPVTPNGGDISIAWSGSGIFAL